MPALDPFGLDAVVDAMKRCCHYCGQALPEHRLGVLMGPLAGRIFDYIVTAGADGISNADLCELTGLPRQTLKVHIYSINEKLSETGYQIAGSTVRKLVRAGNRYHDSDALTPEQQKVFGL